MIHVDTHVLVWLYEGKPERLGDGARDLLDSEQLTASPMAALELTWLKESGRINPEPTEILAWLTRELGLTVDATPFAAVAAEAATETFAFTRDPFDRLIAANARAAGVRLLTKDRRLRNQLDFAIWPD
ncbi:type II toxin-antitoxin system VapC family toxin [Nocardioides sp.]|uniref:type II toxin-antitoxin system VapC family toxin n=1 Tax=Nocardioides sp. TaxID=35761 RepID=UPI0039E3C02F